MLENLLTAGFAESDLPDHERLCRALKKCDAQAQAKVWKTVLKNMKESGNATTEDVEKAAEGLGIKLNLGSKSKDENDNGNTAEKERAEVLADFEKAAKLIKVGLTAETLTPDYRRRIQVALMSISDTVTALMSSLRHHAEAEAKALKGQVPVNQDPHEQFDKAREAMKQQEVTREP